MNGMFNFALLAGAGPWFGFPLKPEDASTTAASVDHLYYFLTALTLFFTILIFSTIFYFMVRYRRRSPGRAS